MILNSRVPRSMLSWSLVLLTVLGTGVARAGDRTPAPPPLDSGRPPNDRVLVEICERGVPQEREWPTETLQATEHYEAEAFGFSRLPHKYVDTGVRADRANPFLLRASARVELPKGKHRLLLRGRGATRLFVDGRMLLSTPFPPPITDGHTPIPTEYLNLGPDFRFAPPGNRETWTHFESPGGEHTVILESIVGGFRGKGRLRPEPGETVAAISLEGSESFQLLAPRRVVPYNDAGWKSHEESEAAAIARLEAERRAEAFRPFAAYWEKRREAARRWLAETPEPVVPPLPPGYPARNAIDHFLADRHAKAAAEAVSAGTVDFPTQIRPILETHCFACHQGRKKVQGQLRLDTAEGALAGGGSGFPAIVPGDPEESELIARVASDDEFERMPPKGPALSDEEIRLLRLWINEGASWSSTTPPRPFSELSEDLNFLRRVSLDIVGVVPTEAEVADFLADESPEKRSRVIDRLLDDPRWADHWVGYWQDVLAENPNILNPTLNNTGPFRWWLYEALLDNVPMDRFVTDLLRMRGSLYLGGPAGFGMASQNDVPMAEKGVIAASAFLGIRMRCARCHDAPARESTQEDLFQIAALLAEKPITVPKSSSVPLDKLSAGGRQPLIQVTLQPGTEVRPAWPFPELATPERIEPLLPEDPSPRDRLAALITAPSNERFAQVIANRVWARMMGRGLIDPPDDWEKGTVSHPGLLDYLARELVRSGYDLKHLVRLIVGSHAYQRASVPELTEPDPLFAAPARRRMTAEQLLDSLFLAAGKPLETEEVNLDVDGGRVITVSINLGKPRRAWQFASTSNERDRPSLSLPRVQAVVDLLEAFGWRSARQNPTTIRETDPNLLQPAILANGSVGVWLTRLSEDHGTTELALEDQPLAALVDRLFLRVLTRRPTPEERLAIEEYLRDGYADRVVEPRPERSAPGMVREPPRYVSWSNHLTEEANAIKLERETEARLGDPPTDRLASSWRGRLEDVLWALLNDPDFLFIP